MLKIKDYAERINQLHEQGVCATEIALQLGFKYPQPVFNYFKKMGWDRLNREEYKAHRVYCVNEQFFETIDTEEKAYILGFICADGYVDAVRKSLVFALKQTDIDILIKIREALQSEHLIRQHVKKVNPYKKSNNKILEQAVFSIGSKTLIKPLIERGLDNNKTYKLDGSEVKDIPEHLMRHFLRGYFDGDGNISWGKTYSTGTKYIVSVCGNKPFLENTFQKHFPSKCNISPIRRSKQCFEWRVANQKDTLKFLCYLYADSTIYLKRKYEQYKYAMWAFKTGLIAGNSYFINLIEGQSAANPLVKSWRQVQRLMDETFPNPYEGEEYNSNTKSQQSEIQIEDIV